MLVSDKYLSTEPPEFRVEGACELLWVKLQIQGLSDLHIGSFYRPPKTTDEAYLTALSHSISKVLYNRNCNVWLGGDFNLGGINWQNSSVSTGPRNSRNCLDLTNDHGLEQMVKSPTHSTDTTEAILDLFLTNNATLVNKVDVIPVISDHEAVYIESSLRPDKIKKPPRKVMQYNKMNKPEMIKKLQETKIEMNNDHQNMTVDEVWDIFKKNVLDAVDQAVSSKIINNNKRLPWITKEIKAPIRKRNKLYQKKKRNKCTRTTNKYHDCKRTLQKKMRQEYWKYLEGIISFDTTDTNSELRETLEAEKVLELHYKYEERQHRNSPIKKQRTLNQ